MFIADGDGAIVNASNPVTDDGINVENSAYVTIEGFVVDGMDRVMAATTLPTLLLGGDRSGPQDEAYASWEKALVLPGVRGLVVGRTLLYPADDDVEAAVDVAASLVHTGPTAQGPP